MEDLFQQTFFASSWGDLMDARIYDQIIKSAAGLPDMFDIELVLGISGSFACGVSDAYSDVDICIFVDGETPSREDRQAAYASIRFVDEVYFDVDFDTSRGDGFIIEGVRCDLNWMMTKNVCKFLSKLGTDFYCPEWLPGGLATVKAIYDPGKLINGLQDQIPVYSIERSRHRVQKALMDAHYSIYKLAWLPKATLRGDIFSILKYQYLLLEKIFYGIFALNRAWFSDEKRLAERIMDFELVPRNANYRIQNIILHKEGRQNLGPSLTELKSLFKDTAACAQLVYPDLDLPVTWD